MYKRQIQNREQAKLESEGLQKAIQQLDERSRRVVEARYLHMDRDGNNKAVTLQELATELGVSAERVRQIEKSALKKLHDYLAPEVEDLLD